MADEKLSALNELATTPANDDEVYIRDVSEAAAQESKRITIANLLASAGGATLTVSETEVFNAAAPTSWTDLDLSGTIGAQVTLVLLKVHKTTGGGDYLAVRKNGDTDEQYQTAANALGVGEAYTASSFWHVLAVVSDSIGKIEWRAGGTDTHTIDVIAYIK